MDIEEYGELAARYVADKDFSDLANEQMRLYNATMKINRLEYLKATLGLDMVAGYTDIDDLYTRHLTEMAMEEQKRMSGILHMTNAVSPKVFRRNAEAIAKGSFKGATFSERIWTNQTKMKGILDEQLQRGLMQGKNPRALMQELRPFLKDQQDHAEEHLLTLLQTEMARVQTEAQKMSYEENGVEKYTFICNELDGRTCPVCKDLDGNVYSVKEMMAGENASPIHPRCRCSTAAYMDREAFEKWLEGQNGAEHSSHESMSRREDIGNWPPPGERISKNKLQELIDYGASNKIDVKSFDNYDGDIELIKSFIDGIVEVSNDYPEILSGKRNLQLRCSYQLAASDYAETTNNCIVINGNAYRDREALRLDYEKQQEGDNPFFVKGTTYENIPHHESGHLIIQVFGLSPKKIIGDADQSLISDYARKNNKEAIAESFSAHYAGVKNETASHVKKNCDIIIAERRRQK